MALLLAGAGCGPAGTLGAGHPVVSAHPRAAGYGPAPRRLCAQPPGQRLRAALSQTVTPSLDREIVPLGLAAGGRSAYVFTRRGSFAGVAALNLGTGRLQAIQRFARPATDQADGAAAGAWLVWAETYSLQSLDKFTVYAWNAASGRVRRLGQSLNAPGGSPWPSPWHPPAVGDGYAAWAQGSGPGGLVQLRLANLATGRVTVIRTGHVQAPFFDRGLVVWPESGRPGAQTVLHGYDPATGRAAVLPPALAAVHGTDVVATDGARTAYLSPSLRSLYYSPAPGQRARVVLRLPAGASFEQLTMGTGWLAWTTTAATYLASLTAGSYARVTPHYGLATGAGDEVLVSDPAGQAAQPVLPLHLIRPGQLTWPPCSG
jgi:hypothetical protein